MTAELSVVRDDAAPQTFQHLADWRRFVVSARQYAPATVESYLQYLLHLQAFLLPRALETATEQDLLRFLDSLEGKGGARGMTIRASRSFFSWLLDAGERSEDPTRRIRVKKPKEGPAPYLTRGEVTRLVIAAAARDPRRGWAVVLMLHTGLRIGSAAHLKPDDIRDGVLYVRVAKGDRPYAVPLNAVAAEAAAELARIAQLRGSQTLLGAGESCIWQWVNEASKDTGVRAWPHLLRHTFATWLAEAHVHPVTIAELMNHGDLSQLLRRYVAVADPTRRAAVEKLEWVEKVL
jgi:integrase